MNQKIKLTILFLLLASTASAGFIELPSHLYTSKTHKFFSKIWECTWHISCYQKKLGAFTTITTSDLLTAFPTAYNANITKTIEVGTSSVASITTLSNLASVGTLTVGSLGSGFTTVAIGRGGTGSSSPSGILWGDGAGAYTSIGQGTAGQVLNSNGATIPTFGPGTVDLTIHYVWTGQHTFGTTSPLVTFQNGTTTFTRNTAKVGIGTTSPEVSLSVATDTVIYGGLGVGSATTTSGNLKVTGFVGIGGTTTTNGLAILGGNICNGCTFATTTIAKVALNTADGSLNQVTATCPGKQIVIGGGYGMFTSNSDELQSNKYIVWANRSSTASDPNWGPTEQSWYVGAKTSGTGEAGFLYAVAICANP